MHHETCAIIVRIYLLGILAHTPLPSYTLRTSKKLVLQGILYECRGFYPLSARISACPLPTFAPLPAPPTNRSFLGWGWGIHGLNLQPDIGAIECWQYEGNTRPYAEGVFRTRSWIDF